MLLIVKVLKGEECEVEVSVYFSNEFRPYHFSQNFYISHLNLKIFNYFNL